MENDMKEVNCKVSTLDGKLETFSTVKNDMKKLNSKVSIMDGKLTRGHFLVNAICRQQRVERFSQLLPATRTCMASI